MSAGDAFCPDGIQPLLMHTRKAIVNSSEEQRQAAEFEMISRRVRPQIILLNVDYSVALAEWDTGSELFQKLGLLSQRTSRLLPEVEKSVRDVVVALAQDPSYPDSFIFQDSIVLRVAILQSEPAPQVALFVEPSRRREDLRSAAKRYNLTRRQVEVLGYILQGRSAREIAAELYITEATVSDHFKQLLLRTAARNRTDMVARVLNWTEPLEGSPNPRK